MLRAGQGGYFEGHGPQIPERWPSTMAVRSPLRGCVDGMGHSTANIIAGGGLGGRRMLSKEGPPGTFLAKNRGSEAIDGRGPRRRGLVAVGVERSKKVPARPACPACHPREKSAAAHRSSRATQSAPPPRRPRTISTRVRWGRSRDETTIAPAITVLAEMLGIADCDGNRQPRSRAGKGSMTVATAAGAGWSMLELESCRSADLWMMPEAEGTGGSTGFNWARWHVLCLSGFGINLARQDCAGADARADGCTCRCGC